MAEWKKTSCVLCAQNCGLEVIVEGSKILKVRADRESPRSQGFICRKGANIAYFQNNPERLKYPLKRVGNRFEQISWKQALDEIAARIKEMEGFQVIVNFLIMPIFFLSGALFPLDHLPAWLTFMTRIDPLTYGVDLLRGTMLNVHSFPLTLDFLVISFFAVVMLAIAVIEFNLLD